RQEQVERLRQALERGSPIGTVRRLRASVDDRLRRQLASVRHALALDAERVRGYRDRLAALDPHAVLGRGYSMCWVDGDTLPVRSVGQVTAGAPLRIQVSDGELGATAEG